MKNKMDFHGVNKVFGNDKKDIKLDVIFIHGLSGHAETTWVNCHNVFWPSWFEEDFDNIAVWTVGYDAAKTAWSSDTMPLEERSLNILHNLVHTKNIGNRPILFIVHSMGGLLLKFILEKSALSKEYESIINNTKGAFFLATPHKGSSISDFIMNFENILRLNDIVKQLQSNTIFLEKLEDNFCEIVRKYDLKCISFFETKEVRFKRKIIFGKINIPKGLIIVNKSSAKGSFNQQAPIGVDKNHIDICKIESKNDSIYKHIEDFIQEVLNENNTITRDKVFTQISNSFEDTEEKKKSISRIFLIFNEDNISYNKYHVIGYVHDNNEFESDLIEFTFQNIHNKEEQENFIEILYEKSQFENIPIHLILPPQLFLVNFKLWKYNGTEFIKIYHILFHNKNRFLKKISKYDSMIENWNNKFHELKDKSIHESLLSVPDNIMSFDNRSNIGAYFSYQPESHTEINKIVAFANVGIWKYSSGNMLEYEDWINKGITLLELNQESRNHDHLALLWDEMELLKELRGER